MAGDNLEIIDIASLKTIKSFEGLERIDTPNIILWSSDGRYLVTAGASSVYVLDVTSGEILQKIPRKSPYLVQLTIDKTSNILSITEKDTPILLWDLQAGKPLKTDIRCYSLMAFSFDNKLIATLDDKASYIELLNIKTGTLVKKIELELMDHIEDMQFTPDGEYLIAGISYGARTGGIKMWRVGDGNLVYAKKDIPNIVATIAISNDGQTMAIGRKTSPGMEGVIALHPEIELRRVSDGKLIKQLKGHSDNVEYILFSKDDKKLISSSSDRTVQFWKLAN